MAIASLWTWMLRFISVYSMIATTTRAFISPSRTVVIATVRQQHRQLLLADAVAGLGPPHAFSRVRWLSAARGRKGTSSPDGESPPSTVLEWDTFEYSESPKWDARFNDTRAVVASSQEELDEIIQEETTEDELMSERLEKYNKALLSLRPEMVANCIRILRPFITKERMMRMEQVLSQRTMHCRFLFENPSNPSNVWACLRTIDSFGIQCVDLVFTSGKYQGKAALAQKRGLRTAVGSAQWLTLRNHGSTKGAVEKLREEGYKIYASDLNPNSRDIRTIDWDADDRPICIVMGNENNGISQEMRTLVDETFTLPMCGFAESFNLSVATAITLAHLSACSKEGSKGPLRPGDMSEHDFDCLRLKGIVNSVAQKRACLSLLKREGIVLPPELGWL